MAHDARRGREAFEAEYGRIYGARWAELRAALETEPSAGALVNPFADDAPRGAEIPGLPGVLAPREGSRFAPPAPRHSGLCGYYLLDPASVIAARAVEPRPGERILDLCAAPGGKTLALAFAAWSGGSARGGTIIANELSTARRARLVRVLDEALPRELRAAVKVSGRDGSRFGLTDPGGFDRALVDAPCSSERHLLADAAEMSRWSAARAKKLAVRQLALLASAFDSVRPGGLVVYSTCSLHPLENDGVVARLLEKRPGHARVAPAGPGPGEETRLGRMILPDRTGWGPIYISRIQRLD